MALLITIAVIGVLCALLGRMLGDVCIYWQIVVGLVLTWVALGMLGVERCNLSGRWLHWLNLKGLGGALLLGLAYGVLSFGFIAPILAIITIQQQVLTGVLLILLFALGHRATEQAIGLERKQEWNTTTKPLSARRMTFMIMDTATVTSRRPR